MSQEPAGKVVIASGPVPGGFAATLFALQLASLSVSTAAQRSCGKLWPTYAFNLGWAEQQTLAFGVPAAFFTTETPTLAGCAPKSGYYNFGSGIVKYDWQYATGALTDVPLIQAAHSNNTQDPSFKILYESQVHGMALPLRIKQVEVEGVQNGTFTYDKQGRLVRIDWFYNGTTSARSSLGGWRSPGTTWSGNDSAPARLVSPVQYRPPIRQGSASIAKSTRGYEKLGYMDAEHPLLPTYREVLDQDGRTALGYRWSSRGDGMLTDIVAFAWEPATCPTPCQEHTICCQEVGVDGTPACFVTESCDSIGGINWHYDYDSGRLVSMNQSGTVQRYEYSDDGRISSYRQGDTTLFKTWWKEGNIASELFWLIYPVIPEAWGFDPPKEGVDMYV